MVQLANVIGCLRQIRDRVVSETGHAISNLLGSSPLSPSKDLPHLSATAKRTRTSRMSFLLDMPGGTPKTARFSSIPYERLRLTPRRQSETLAVAAASHWTVGQPRTCGQAKGVLHVIAGAVQGGIPIVTVGQLIRRFD